MHLLQLCGVTLLLYNKPPSDPCPCTATLWEFVDKLLWLTKTIFEEPLCTKAYGLWYMWWTNMLTKRQNQKSPSLSVTQFAFPDLHFWMEWMWWISVLVKLTKADKNFFTWEELIFEQVWNRTEVANWSFICETDDNYNIRIYVSTSDIITRTNMQLL